jgi:hypothetical protein
MSACAQKTVLERFEIKSGNTLPALTATLSDDAGVVNLSGCTVELLLSEAPAHLTLETVSQATLVFKHAGMVTSALTGGVAYQWAAGETDEPGSYLAEFKVTDALGRVKSYPTRGYILVLIKSSLG